MNNLHDTNQNILVVEDIAETRDGIQKLLQTDGYRVALADGELAAIKSVRQTCPDLILVSLAGRPREVILAARRIRKRAGIGEHVPVVVFCIEDIDEGEEVDIGGNVYSTRPDNFNQLRRLLARLLYGVPITA